VDAGVQFKLEYIDDGAGVICMVPIERMRSLLERYPTAYTRFFCPAELEYCRQQTRFPWQHYAVRLAAKFAYRALIERIAFNCIEVQRSAAGTPSIAVTNGQSTENTIWLSLSHEGELAVAFLRRD